MTSSRSARALTAVVALMLLLGACDASISFGDSVRGSGELESAFFDDFDSFEEIDVSSAFDVIVTVAAGDAATVDVLANENLIEELDIRVRNGTLKIGLRDGVSMSGGTLEATVTVPELTAVEVSGASKVVVVGATAAEQTFEVTGASELDVTTTSERIEVEATGASEVRLFGTASELELSTSGSTDASADLGGLESAEVDLSGASSVQIEAVDRVTGDLSGASDLVVPSSTDVDVTTSGTSSVERAG